MMISVSVSYKPLSVIFDALTPSSWTTAAAFSFTAGILPPVWPSLSIQYSDCTGIDLCDWTNASGLKAVSPLWQNSKAPLKHSGLCLLLFLLCVGSRINSDDCIAAFITFILSIFCILLLMQKKKKKNNLTDATLPVSCGIQMFAWTELARLFHLHLLLL